MKSAADLKLQKTITLQLQSSLRFERQYGSAADEVHATLALKAKNEIFDYVKNHADSLSKILELYLKDKAKESE